MPQFLEMNARGWPKVIAAAGEQSMRQTQRTKIGFNIDKTLPPLLPCLQACPFEDKADRRRAKCSIFPIQR